MRTIVIYQSVISERRHVSVHSGRLSEKEILSTLHVKESFLVDYFYFDGLLSVF